MINHGGCVNIKIISIIGTRPNFTKMAPLIDALNNKGHEHLIIHTGQHYDQTMSEIFFDELNISCNKNLEIGSGSHGYQTGMMLIEIEKILMEENVDIVLIPGDTNSALAGALAASKLNIPIAHVESGLRSFDKRMPEEVNRILVDHCADYLFCPTETAINNISNEGINNSNVFLVGDTMVESSSYFLSIAQKKSDILKKLSIDDEFYLATIHRAENTDDPRKLKGIFEAFFALDCQIILPLHPRTRSRLESFGLLDSVLNNKNIKIIDPVGYIDFLMLLKNAKLMLTDSGGVQKEAFFLKTPCITIRENTEWVETISVGWNLLVDSNKDAILKGTHDMLDKKLVPCENPYGDGKASQNIIEILERSFI